MGNFISMMSIDSTVKFINANKFVNDINPYDAVAICEFGMNEVLRQVAVSQLGQYEPQHSPKYHEILEQVVELQGLIDEVLTDEQKIINENLDSAQHMKELMECDQHYIDGFLAGYKFLREITKQN